MQVAAALVGAAAALSGAAVAGGVGVWVEHKRSRAAERAERRQDLVKSCAEFTGAITSVRSLSYRIRADPDVDPLIVEAMDQARTECERLRLLLESQQTQRAARLALRHAYAVWRYARDRVDPRADQFPEKSPYERLRDAMTELYIGARTEIGTPAPQDVFEDLDD